MADSRKATDKTVTPPPAEPVAADAPAAVIEAPAPAPAPPVAPPAPEAAAAPAPAAPAAPARKLVALVSTLLALRTYNLNHELVCKKGGMPCSCSKGTHPQATRAKDGTVGIKNTEKLHPAVLTFLSKQTLSGLDEAVLLAPEVAAALESGALKKV